ncbi:MAG: hypothetical protein WCH13_16785 [Deltaproteobacteria bacterium]
MAREDLILGPESLETLIAGLGDLRTALGSRAAPGLEAVRDDLRRALAARQGGDRDGAIEGITTAMRRLAGLADLLDPAEASMMRAVASQFEGALRRGEAGDAARSVDLMRERSGARKKRGDENKL